MRITGGVLLNRRVICPPGIIRPAMDRMRESLFSILQSRMDLKGISFLDLFSGSGLLSLEAASRGASLLHAVEKDYGKKAVILKNFLMLDSLDCEYKLFLNDAFKFLERDVHPTYDIIYADPPFPLSGKEKLLTFFDKNPSFLKDDGYFIVHIPSEDIPLWSEENEFCRRDLEREYGRSRLLFYKKKAKI